MPKKILLSIFILTLQTHLLAAVWPGDTWQTASPESQGMSSAKLAQAPSRAEIEMGDVIVIRNGYDVWRYGDAYGRQGNTSSVVRSYLTTLYGIENEGWQIHLNKTEVWKGLPRGCYAALGACDRSSILVCPSLNLVIARKGPTSSPYSDRCVDSPQRWAKPIFDAIDDKVSLPRGGGAALADDGSVAAAELSVEDFDFRGPFGSQGATIEKLGGEHFKVTLGHAPEHPTWCNMLQFQILRNAKGKRLRLDVVFLGGDAYRFNHYPFSSWSCDGKNWQAIYWEKKSTDSSKGDTLLFPEFREDTVYFGHQVPMSYENVVEMLRQWEKHPHVQLRVLGKSLGGRDLYRMEITDPGSPHARAARWVHYFANQHPGEHNSQWRMVSMVNWLLSDKGADCRRRSICHFIMMMSPDAPSCGWYRVNAQGVDMNRSYFAAGANKKDQAHEAYLAQKDVESLMTSDAPVTDVWGMHTWGGIVEPLIRPGPEMGTTLGPWTGLRDAIIANDPKKLVKPLKVRTNAINGTTWTGGPHKQFGITVVLCEGAGSLDTKQQNIESGEALIKGIAEYYKGTRP